MSSGGAGGDQELGHAASSVGVILRGRINTIAPFSSAPQAQHFSDTETARIWPGEFNHHHLRTDKAAGVGNAP